MSSLSEITSDELASLNGKTIVVTGGASGIGKATCFMAHDEAAGAKVVIADMNAVAGDELATQLQERAIFIPTDVSKWDSTLSLFRTAYETFGRIDIVYANAGVHSFENLLADEVDEAGKLEAPSLRSIEINLHGVLYTTKAAVHYFSKNPEVKHQLIITGSAASLIDTPPLYMYCAAKAGALGLMRGLRSTLPAQNITINLVAPWMTVTEMVPQWIIDMWGDLPANNTDGVAKALLIPAVRPILNGLTIWVAGNKAVELEELLHRDRATWMGAELSASLNEGQRRMGIGSVF